MTNLAAAILDHTTGWELLLGQIGLPYRVVHNVQELSPETVALVVVNRHLWSEEQEKIESYLRAGGAVLDVGQFLQGYDAKVLRRRNVGSVLVENGNSFLPGIPVLDLHCRVAEHRSGTELNGLVHVAPCGAGTLGFLGFDPGKAVLDSRSCTRAFSAVDGALPAERVSRLTKGGIARLLRSLLVRLYHERGLPFVCKRSFPDSAPNVLCFRIDSDYGNQEQIETLYRLAQTTQTRMTWFLHLEAHQGWLSTFAAFEDQEIALHCQRHRTFPEYEENATNIAEGLDVLRGAGFQVEGFSSPNGVWNHGLAQAIDEHGFLYSSEFGLGYDMLPFQPPLPLRQRVNRRFYSALQIPIHPVSVSNLARVGVPDQRMIEYYQNVVRRKMASGDPLMFYHHPTHGRWDVVSALLQEAHSYGPRSMMFAEYARWWKLRQDAMFKAEFGEDCIEITSHQRDTSVWFDVIAPDGTETMVNSDGKQAVNAALKKTETTSQDGPPFEQVAELRRFSLTMKRRALHDWIIRTGR